MNIKIDENYSIKSDLRNVILVENKITEEGKEYDSPIGYYGTIESALKGYLKTRINLSNATTIQELLAEIKNTKKIIENTLKEI
jgi:hypothetical protein